MKRVECGSCLQSFGIILGFKLTALLSITPQFCHTMTFFDGDMSESPHFRNTHVSMLNVFGGFFYLLCVSESPFPPFISPKPQFCLSSRYIFFYLCLPHPFSQPIFLSHSLAQMKSEDMGHEEARARRPRPPVVLGFLLTKAFAMTPEHMYGGNSVSIGLCIIGFTLEWNINLNLKHVANPNPHRSVFFYKSLCFILHFRI